MPRLVMCLLKILMLITWSSCIRLLPQIIMVLLLETSQLFQIVNSQISLETLLALFLQMLQGLYRVGGFTGRLI